MDEVSKKQYLSNHRGTGSLYDERGTNNSKVLLENRGKLEDEARKIIKDEIID